jgi:glycosyltransferase involved in cell wall biosynthesis
MQYKKKVCWVVASPLTIKFFLMKQIASLARDYDMTIVTNSDDPAFLTGFDANVKVIPVTIERKVSLIRDLVALFSLISIFRREKYDLVHTLSPKAGLLAILASWLVQVPVRIHVFQGEVWVTRTGLWRWFLKALDKWMARCATHLLVVSRSEEAFLVEQGVVPDGRLEMLGSGSICGVDLNRFMPNLAARAEVRQQYSIAEGDKVILYVGRLTIDKGLLDLAISFNQLSQEYSDIHLLVVGPDEEGIRKKMQAHCPVGVNRLYFQDYTSTPEFQMAASDILCLPSYREGFGLVLIEAGAVGIPTVGSRIYGISDAVQEDETGLLFRSGDVSDLTKKLRTLLDDPQLARKLGKAGRERVQKSFDSELILAKLRGYYEDVLINSNDCSK